MRVTLELQLYVPAPEAEPELAGDTLVVIVSVHGTAVKLATAVLFEVAVKV